MFQPSKAPSAFRVFCPRLPRAERLQPSAHLDLVADGEPGPYAALGAQRDAHGHSAAESTWPGRPRSEGMGMEKIGGVPKDLP